jgi:hypothetical protein
MDIGLVTFVDSEKSLITVRYLTYRLYYDPASCQNVAHVGPGE